MIIIKTKQEIEAMAQAGKMLARVMKRLEAMVKPGLSTKELDRAAEALILESGAEPAFKGYGGFPAALCASVNAQIVHAIPGGYKLKPGDLLSLDLGLKYKGFYSDMAVTKIVGVVGGLTSDNSDNSDNSDYSDNSENFEAKRLVRVCAKALKLGIKKARPGSTFGDIGNTIQRFVEGQGFSVVRDLVGHGIGRALHEEPKIPNYGKRRSGGTIGPGMVFCLEPMITMGDWRIKQGADGFSYETRDGSLSAHFEHMVAVLESGPRVLTKT